MQLRSMTYPSTGEYVLVRLRSSVTEVSVDLYNTLPTEGLPFSSSVGLKKSRRKKKRGSKNKKNKGDNRQRSKQVVKASPSIVLSDDQFPSLFNGKVEWEASALDTPRIVRREDLDVEQDDDQSEGNGSKYDEEMEPKSCKPLSDAASTATTTSSTVTTSSNGEKQVVVPGYAAAVMKGIPKPSVVHEAPSSGSTSSLLVNDPTKKDSRQSFVPPPVFQEGPWKGSRSFVDVARPEQPKNTAASGLPV